MATDDNDTVPEPRAADAAAAYVRRRNRSSTATQSNDDRYAIRETLGRGGMGEVLAARDDVLGRDVAIKRMLSAAPSPTEVARFLREARIQGALDHPAIPPVHELAHDVEGRPFFVMKRLSGTTLREILHAQREGDAAMIAKYPREALLRAFCDVCLAVELAHTRGIVHRDLKPANIMLGNFGEVFVLDWGVAKVIGDADSWLDSLRDPTGQSQSSDTTQAGHVIGTPAYMAPEQQRSGEIDGRADVFALGCILYEILAGTHVPPFKPTDGLHPAQHETANDVPPELDLACAAATSETAAARPTARVLGQRVQQFLDGDRDLALRRTLAAAHLAAATKAAEQREDPAQQRIAIREAGRALALDPTLAGAAELVSQLMLEPPRAIPADVVTAIAADHRASEREHARIGLMAYGAYVAFLPFLFFLGITKPELIAVFAGMLLLLVANAYNSMRTQLNAPWHSVVAILGNSVLLAIVARMFTPFVIAPGVAALTVFFLVGSPAYRRGWRFALLVSATIASMVVPWLLEITGVISPTIVWSPDHIELRNLAIEIKSAPMQIGVMLYACALITVAATVRRLAALGEEDAQRRLHVQAWQLRQLVPE